MASIADNLHRIQDRLSVACERSGRRPSEGGTAGRVQDFSGGSDSRGGGRRPDFVRREQKAQESLAKQPALPSKLRWHVIWASPVKQGGASACRWCRRSMAWTRFIWRRNINRIGGERVLFEVYLEVNVAAESTKTRLRA